MSGYRLFKSYVYVTDVSTVCSVMYKGDIFDKCPCAVHYLCFSLRLVEGTHREHVQLVEVDAPDVAHVDGTLNMSNMTRIHNSMSVRGRWLFLTDCVSSDKCAMAS